MEITKAPSKFNTYRMELSFGELVALENAMADNHAGPVADELWAGMRWYLDKLPKPGEDGKGGEEGEEGALGAPEGGIDIGIALPNTPVDTDAAADELLPAPPADGMGGGEPLPAGDEEVVEEPDLDAPGGDIEFEIEKPEGFGA